MTSLGMCLPFIVLIFIGSVLTTSIVNQESATTSPLDCDFEDRHGGFCRWTQDKEDNPIRGDYYSNKIRRTSTSSSGNLQLQLQTGKVMRKGLASNVRSSYAPRFDHTLGNIMGHFLYLKTIYDYQGKKVRLISPNVDIPANGVCFRFWYHMYGPDVGRINVYANRVKNDNDDNDDEKDDEGKSKHLLVWTKGSTQGPGWKSAHIHIQNFTGMTFITVELVTGSRIQNPALDDFEMSYGPCLPTNMCDFEDGQFCSYGQANHDENDLKWVLYSPGFNPEEATVISPKTDHTFGTPDGHFARIDTTLSTRVKGQVAILNLNTFPPTSGSCLSFWYYMGRETAGTLRIRMEILATNNIILNDTSRIFWSTTGNQGDDWQMATVNLKSQDDFKVTFEGIVGSNSTSDLAIDDISVTSGMCPNFGSCDFESDLCSWKNDLTTDDLDWTREATRHNSNEGFPPAVDHSFNNYLGHYLYLDPGKGHHREVRVGKFISPNLEKEKIYCLNAWYDLGDVAKLAAVTQQTIASDTEEIIVFNISSTERSSSATSKTRWSNLRLVIGPLPTGFKIILIGSVSRYNGGIAVDDLDIQEGHCENLTSPEQTKNAFVCSEGGQFLSAKDVCDFQNDCPNGEEEEQCGYDCDFEDGTTCKWEVSETGKYAWQVKPKSFTGVHGSEDNRDYSSLYLETKTGVRWNDDAASLLLSPFFQRAAPSCELVFSMLYYKVDDEDFIVQKVEGIEEILLFEARGDYGSKWQSIVIPLGESEVPFRVILTGKRSRYEGNRGFIAVDDIRFRNCDFPQPNVSCSAGNENQTFHCNNGACVQHSKLCNFVDDCGDASDELDTNCLPYHRCAFEDDHLCDWTQELELDDFDFTIRKGTRPGPFVDHTTGTEFGHFLWVDTGNFDRLPGDKAWLVSPVLEPSTSCVLEPSTSCVFNFYLYMHGKNIEPFSVFIRSVTHAKVKKVFTQTEETGRFWVFYSLHIESSDRYQIVLEAISGKARNDEIAIDDVILSPGCNITSDFQPISKTTPSPESSCHCKHPAHWQCVDGLMCVHEREVCDFATHCSDGSDEMNCGSCDFETSMCGWTDKTRGRYFWAHVNASSFDDLKLDSKLRPSVDKGVGESFMVLLDKGSGYDRPGVLESPIFGSTESGCSIRFYYFMDHYKGHARLQIYPKEMTLYERNHGDNIWTSDMSTEWKWEEATIGSRAAGFRLVFKFSSSYSPLKKGQYGVAIDAISFSPECGASKSSLFCSEEEFKCNSNSSSSMCLPISSQCDLTSDCPHGKDEEQCEKYLRCDFETGLGFFALDNTKMNTSKVSWVIQQANNTLLHSGNAPDEDHTLKLTNGHYLYLYAEPSVMSSGFADQVAKVRGPVMFGNREGGCRVMFFYTMKGSYAISLNVYTETREGGVLDLKWSARDEIPADGTGTGTVWKKANVELLEHSFLFRLVIEGVRVPGYLGDIGIDDVTFTPECAVANDNVLPPGVLIPNNDKDTKSGSECKQGAEFACDNNCLPIERWCDFKKDCKDGTDEATCPSQCDFEDGGNMCGWTSESDGRSPSVIWEPKGASELKITTDHKPGAAEGHVMSSTIKNTRIYVYELSFVSPLFVSSSKNCEFSFWLMQQAKRPKLQLKVRDGSGLDRIIWLQDQTKETGSSKTGTWQRETVSLPPCLGHFQLVLYLKTFKDGSLPLYLDDLSFHGCTTEVPNGESCADGEFRCINGQCVSEDALCDLNNDCCDWSDETHVMCRDYDKMTFETGTGRWKHKTGAQRWKRVQAAERAGKMGGTSSSPRNDHTYTLSSGGHFLQADCLRSEPAIIQHEMPKPAGTCIVQFWYAITGEPSGSITVVATTINGNDTRKLLASFETTTNSSWLRADLKVTMGERFDLFIETDCENNGYSSSVNIDDVIFSPGCRDKLPVPPTTPPTTENTPTLPTFSTLTPSTPTTRATTKTTIRATIPTSTRTPPISKTPPTFPVKTTPHTAATPIPKTSSAELPRPCKDITATGHFRCVSDKSCIPTAKVCDSTQDCTDGSDEKGCKSVTTTTQASVSQDSGQAKVSQVIEEDWRTPLAVVLTISGIISLLVAIAVIWRRIKLRGKASFVRFHNNERDDVNIVPMPHVSDVSPDGNSDVMDTVRYSGECGEVELTASQDSRPPAT